MNDFLLKIASTTIMPPGQSMLSKLVRGADKGLHLPKPGKVPVIGSGDFGKTLHVGEKITGAMQNAPTIAPKLASAGVDAFFAELAELRPDLMDKIARADVEEMMKAALNLGGMGSAIGGAMRQGASAVGGALQKGVQGVGGALGGALQSARGGIASAAGKISPTLNKPVMQAAQGAAHSLQKSPNAFAQGVGNVLHHKVQTPGKAFLAAANPVGTAAEALTAGAGTAASKGLAGAGTGLVNRFGGDAVTQQARAMTPKGRLMNAAAGVGNRLQSSFSAGGTGHNVLTKKLPVAAEIGGAVGAGMALHAPVGLAGVLGKAGLVGAGKAVPALGAALEHAPHAVDAIAQKITPALRGAGHVAEHTGADILGTAKQNLASRFGAPAAAAAGHSMLPPAPAV